MTFRKQDGNFAADVKQKLKIVKGRCEFWVTGDMKYQAARQSSNAMLEMRCWKCDAGNAVLGSSRGEIRPACVLSGSCMQVVGISAVHF